MADQDETRKASQGDKSGEAFVAGPKGRRPTRAEAEAMAGALYDAINKGRAKAKPKPPAQG